MRCAGVKFLVRMEARVVPFALQSVQPMAGAYNMVWAAEGGISGQKQDLFQKLEDSRLIPRAQVKIWCVLVNLELGRQRQEDPCSTHTYETEV